MTKKHSSRAEKHAFTLLSPHPTWACSDRGPCTAGRPWNWNLLNKNGKVTTMYWPSGENATAWTELSSSWTKQNSIAASVARVKGELSSVDFCSTPCRVVETVDEKRHEVVVFQAMLKDLKPWPWAQPQPWQRLLLLQSGDQSSFLWRCCKAKSRDKISDLIKGAIRFLPTLLAINWMSHKDHKYSGFREEWWGLIRLYRTFGDLLLGTLKFIFSQPSACFHPSLASFVSCQLDGPTVNHVENDLHISVSNPLFWHWTRPQVVLHNQGCCSQPTYMPIHICINAQIIPVTCVYIYTLIAHIHIYIYRTPKKNTHTHIHNMYIFWVELYVCMHACMYVCIYGCM